MCWQNLSNVSRHQLEQRLRQDEEEARVSGSACGGALREREREIAAGDTHCVVSGVSGANFRLTDNPHKPRKATAAHKQQSVELHGG